MPEIRRHEWFLKSLPEDLAAVDMMNDGYEEPDQPMQSMDEIMRIISEATIPAAGTQSLDLYMDDDMIDDLDSDLELDFESSGEIVYAM